MKEKKKKKKTPCSYIFSIFHLSVTINMYNRKNCCWNCGSAEHLRYDCPEPPRKVCSFCRKPDVLSKDCTCQNGLDLKLVLPGAVPMVSVTIGHTPIEAGISTVDPISIAGRDAIELARQEHIHTPRYSDKEWTAMRTDNRAAYYTRGIPITIKGKTQLIECILDPFANHPLTLGMNALRAFGYSFTFMGEELTHRTRPLAILHHKQYPTETLKTDKNRYPEPRHPDRPKPYPTKRSDHTSSQTINKTGKHIRTLKEVLDSFMKDIKTKTNERLNRETPNSATDTSPQDTVNERLKRQTTGKISELKEEKSTASILKTRDENQIQNKTWNQIIESTLDEDLLLYSGEEDMDFEHENQNKDVSPKTSQPKEE